MPAITIFDDSRGSARNRPTSLPAEARSLSRMLRLLDDPQIAANALSQALDALPHPPSTESSDAALQRVKKQVSKSILEMREAGWKSLPKKYAEYHMALAVESVLQDPSSFQAKTNYSSGDNYVIKNSTAINDHISVDDSSTGASSVIPATKKARRDESRDFNRGERSPSSLSSLITSLDDAKPAPTNGRTHCVARRAALISDSSSTEEFSFGAQVGEEGNFGDAGEVADDQDNEVNEFIRARTVRHIWATILESLHLQIASRTTRVWGRKKIYEIYQFAKPIQDASAGDMAPLRQQIETECQRILPGVVDVASACRVYTAIQPLPGADSDNFSQAICVQISLGKPLDLHDERNRSVSGEKKKKAGGEFVALLVPGSTLFALTASRAPSRSRYTVYVLAALETVMTDTTQIIVAATNKNVDATDLATKRVGDISGTEPCDLLRAARSMRTGEATGRFANMATKDKSNPISDLQTATTGSLLVEQNAAETRRLEIGSMHRASFALAVEAASIAAANETAVLGAASRSGDTLLVDYATIEKQTRKRSRIQELGRAKDCPSMQWLCWKWSGETAAAAMCCLGLDGSETVTTDCDGKPLLKTEFKCAVAMKGDNVVQGIQALVDAGLFEAPLPDFIRAPSMGGTIRVDHGSYAAGAGTFEEV